MYNTESKKRPIIKCRFTDEELTAIYKKEAEEEEKYVAIELEKELRLLQTMLSDDIDILIHNEPAQALETIEIYRAFAGDSIDRAKHWWY